MSNEYKYELFDVTCKIIKSTNNAVFIDDGTVQCWLPKSVIEIDRSDIKFEVVSMPMWLAREKGLC